MTAGLADWMTLGGIVAILAFLWSLNRDLRNEIAELRERMARLEGLFEGFVGRNKPPAEWRRTGTGRIGSHAC